MKGQLNILVILLKSPANNYVNQPFTHIIV